MTIRCVVPLAGPDVVHPAAGLVPLMPVDGEPLIRRALSSRAWAGRLRCEDYVFVLRDMPATAELSAFLSGEWPGCRLVILPDVTGGAMLTALAGVATLSMSDGPIVVDLADILFDDGPTLEVWPETLGGTVPCFRSDEQRFSYLDIQDGKVTRTAEKVVISDAASAGVYMFRDPGVYMAAAAHSVANADALAYKNSLFVCPMMNGVLAQGLDVAPAWVSGIRVVGKP